MFAIKMWLWQAEGPLMGTGTDETFAPGQCLPRLPLSKYEAEEHSLPHHHQSVSDSSWDISFDGFYLDLCVLVFSVHTTSKLTYLLKDNTNQIEDNMQVRLSKLSFL